MRLTTTPYLRIRRPSPTTAEFTVSTLPPLTPSLRMLLLSITLLRTVLSLQLVLILYTLWASRSSPPSSSSPLSLLLAHLHHALTSPSPPARLASYLLAHIPGYALAPACAGALYALARARVHDAESLLVLRGLGVQTSGGRFIPTGKIRDVLVNEAFRGFEVRTYLVVVVDGEDDVVVVFPRLLPGARIVERVWRGVRECLYEEGKRGWEGEGGGRGIEGGWRC
ncbi:GPI-GlcNAc transferase complex, PIG-H component-domain-containing protein [Camillea tinctor]|nr:GPI-GlcNAc transferase complex, PIG-H component-domain-containing protein [Camillea tinctor]